MIKLLGARKFIDLPAGTLYSECWLNSVKQCEEMIVEFKNNPSKFLDFSDLMIYDSNGASALLYSQDSSNKVWLTDINVVGDANPDCTLRIVFDIDDIPDTVVINGYEKGLITFTKQDIMKITEKVKNNTSRNEEWEKKNIKWAYEELEKRYQEGNRIIDTEIEINI